MEDAINFRTFLDYLTYYVKVGIYINKGTDNDKLLERCIKFYNKYKKMEVSTNENDEIYIRKCLKRLNLVLKIDEDGNPVNIRNKDNQTKMVYLICHPSITNNDMKSMIEFATTNHIDIFHEIPLAFMLKESKYQELMWQYTRALFYISQILISKTNDDDDPNDKLVIKKREVFDESINGFGEIIKLISEIDEMIKVNQAIALDKFLNNKLVKTGISEKDVNGAREEVKEIFKKKGINNNNSMTKIVDSISDKLGSIDLSQGNILQNMFGIAQSVAQEMRPELEENPEGLQSTLGTITQIFQDTMNDTSNGEQVPAEIKSMIGNLMSIIPGNGDEQVSEEEVNKKLEEIIGENGLDKDEFLSSIRGDDNQIDTSKLQQVLRIKDVI